MAKFVIHGPAKLRGKVKIQGAKNAATPMLAASILTSEPCFLENVPRIGDVLKMIDILKSMGAEISWSGEHNLRVCCKKINPDKINQNLIRTMRSSVLLLGPLIARFGKAVLSEPGGCLIGNRPIDTHLFGLERFGVKIKREKGLYYFKAEKIKATTIVLPEFSVTATENLLMLASRIKGESVVKVAAAEPHVQNLAEMLVQMGVKIEGIGTHSLKIKGCEFLRGVRQKIIPDQIEIGTFAVAAALTKGEVDISPAKAEHLESILLKLHQIGVPFTFSNGHLYIHPSHKLNSFHLQALPYPGFPTDLQAPFGLLATQAQGTSLIHDPLFEGRMGYVNELIKMGANAILADPHRVIITGPTPLYGRNIESLDLRAGATLIIAGLVAHGKTIINQGEIIDRGYEKIEEKLRSLGADIKRID